MNNIAGENIVADINWSARVSAFFEIASRPIGLILLVILLYSQILLGIEANNIAWVVSGVLLAGDKLAQAMRNK